MTPETLERAIGVARSYPNKKVQAIIVITDDETYWVVEEYVPAVVIGNLESIKMDVVAKMKEDTVEDGQFPKMTGRIL